MKPTMIITNSPEFGELNLGPVGKSRKRRAKKTTNRYEDKAGKVRFNGNKTLKTSQTLCLRTGKIPKGLQLKPQDLWNL